MKAHIGAAVAASLLGIWLNGCHTGAQSTPPPDVRRPELKSEDELTAERAERIERGEIVPTSAPALGSAARTATQLAPTTRPASNSIQADILLVNEDVITVPEVLFPLREQLQAIRAEHTRSGYLEESRRLIRRQTQQEIGTLLIYREARGKLSEEQQKSLDATVDKELSNLIQREFDGSAAKFSAHLKECGLSREKYRDGLARMLVVRQYTKERLSPQVQIRRDELIAIYRANAARYETPATRELLLIEVPYAKYLPAERTWETSTPPERAQAKLKATRRIREAAAALQERPWADVAREFSAGLHAGEGGSWGPIARPLQPPYDKASSLIFEHEADWTSEPLETEQGWLIVRCGAVQEAQRRPFADVQEEIRKDASEKRFNRLSMDYILRLAENATISSLEPFVTAALQKADEISAATRART